MPTWSYSKLKSYEICPRQIFYKVPYEQRFQSEEAETGIDVHGTIEKYLKKEITELPTAIPMYETIEMLADIPGIQSEIKLAITKDLKPTGWNDKDTWGRCIIDALDVNERTIKFYDFKTGGINYIKAADQGQIIAMFLSCHYPNRNIEGVFIYLNYNKKKIFEYDSIDITRRIKPIVMARIDRMEKDTALIPRPFKSICNRCAVKNICEFSAAEEEKK